jgi:signal transduction histidine kinase
LRPNLAQSDAPKPGVIPLRPLPPTDASGSDAAARTASLLRAAVEEVRAAVERSGADDSARAEALVLLDVIASAIQEAARGGPLPQGGPAACALGRELLEDVRAAVLRSWRSAPPGPGAADVLALLESVERAREAIAAERWEDFRNRLAGPDGLDLVVGVAHDLRSPLTSILFLAETLGHGRSGTVNELQQRQLRLIYSAALGLNSLASDVIELARGGERLIETEPEPFSLSEMIESLHAMVRPIAEEKGLEIRHRLPPSDRRLGRPLMLSRVLLNLTTNALKFTDSGYVEIVGKAKGRVGVEFSVNDTGHGISQEALAELYEPFQSRRPRRVRKSQHHFSGTGLGLAMCRRLVEAMGSVLECESEEGKGTRFHFTVQLPIESRL